MDVVVDLLTRYADALPDVVAWWLLAAAACLPVVRRAMSRIPAWAWAVTIAIAALAWAWHLRWISDDAFISFRYARNWARGDGLVYNLGERVEGYTNFLWTAILTLPALVGASVPATALALDLASFAGVLAIVNRLAARLAPGARVSFAAVALACSYTFASFATSGLETMPAILLILLALDRASATLRVAARPGKAGACDRALAGAMFVAGLAGIGATMMHPDHAVFYVALGLALAIRRTPLRGLVAYATPFVAIYVPYYAIRWAYYGDFFPNTYYAKAGGDTYWEQGFTYIGASGLASGMWAVLPLAIAGLVQLRRSLAGTYALIALPLYVAYVAKIGGDYMLGRLVCAAMPIALLAAEVAVRGWIARGHTTRAAAALAIASITCAPVHLLQAGDIVWYLTDERTFYPVESVFPLRLGGRTATRVAALDHYFAGEHLAYAAWAIGYTGWVLDGPILDLHGLVDRELAHAPLTKRDRPGHERKATPDYVIAHDVDLSGMCAYPDHAALSRLTLDGVTFYFVHYRPEIAERLRGQPGAHFIDFPAYLDAYIASLPTRGCAELERDAAFFDAYYFSRVHDDAREAIQARQRACAREATTD